MHDDERAADAELGVARDLERPGDRRLADPLGADPHLDLVLEHEHLQELSLDLPPRVVPPLFDEAELPPDPGLGHLRPAERGREVDPPAGVRVHPGHARFLHVLYGHLSIPAMSKCLSLLGHVPEQCLTLVWHRGHVMV